MPIQELLVHLLYPQQVLRTNTWDHQAANRCLATAYMTCTNTDSSTCNSSYNHKKTNVHPVLALLLSWIMLGPLQFAQNALERGPDTPL